MSTSHPEPWQRRWGHGRNSNIPRWRPASINFGPRRFTYSGNFVPQRQPGLEGCPRETDTTPMLSASRRALQLLSSSIPVKRMGDSASKVIRAEEALPGRSEPIPVAGKAAEHAPGACAQRPPGRRREEPRVGPMSGSARARRSSAPTFSLPASPGGAGAQRGSLLPACFSLFESRSERL